MLSILLIISFAVSLSDTIPLNEFFPYGSQTNDSMIQLNNINGINISLPYEITYFDNYYRQMWITSNGVFSFLPPTYHFNTPSSFSSLNNSCFLIGYWHQIAYGGDSNSGNQIYYHIYDHNQSSSNSIKVFTKVENYIEKYFPDERQFTPKMVVISTWYYIGSRTIDYITSTSISLNNTSGNNQLNNTFQIVLSTDEDRTFVFFLYNDLQWSDPYNGTFGGHSNARAGFHCSERNVSEALPHSGTENITKLVNESNREIAGLFVYRVDRETINTHGCNESDSTISFRPRMSGQFGSTPLYIYGPCFTKQTKIKCQFNSSIEIIDGFVLDPFRAVCLTPFSSIHGSIPVSISIDNGQTFISAGQFTYTPLKFGEDEVTIEGENGDSLLNAEHEITLKWKFSDLVKNTFPNGTQIDIQLWKINDNQQLQKDNQFILLQQNLNLMDSIRFQLPKDIANISTCFIRVLAHLNSQFYAGLNTGLLIVRNQPLLATKLCENWILQQPQPSTWNRDDLLLCPMTLLQAQAAARCCYTRDSYCYRGNSNPKNCWLHQARHGYDEPSAIECYLSIIPNRHGSGAKCCYDNNTMLITRGIGAGTDNRYQPTISTVKHLFHDTLPYLQCCRMNTTNEMCDKYMYYRPPRRGSNTMGDTGRMWGDPHFGTLDGLSYTFNGYGEYTYLAISQMSSPPADFHIDNQSLIFMSQIRTFPLSPISNATVTEGFAARSYDAQAQPISVTVSHRRRDQILILRRGNELIEFEDNINTLYFPELTITRLDAQNEKHFSFLWNIGVTIEINVIQMTSPSEQLVLNIGASVAEFYQKKTYGLLGNYDGISNNDLRNRHGQVINSNASLEQIHKDFGVTWAIDPSKSLFYYESNQSAEYFQTKNHTFIPSFDDPTTTNNMTIRNQCNINSTLLPSSWNIAQRTCYYDLSMTNDLNFAQTSFHAANELESIRQNQRKPPLFDLNLPISMNIKYDQLINVTISASSAYPSHVVKLYGLHLPKNSIFNNSTGIFTWKAILGEHYLSIEAHDIDYNLKSKHDIQFYVNRTNSLPPNPDHNSNNRVYPMNYVVLVLGIILRIG